MKFLVRTSFGGCIEQVIEADNQQQAFQKADDALENMNYDQFMADLDPERLGQDAEQFEVPVG
jgi:hypothetical protein